MSAPFQSFADEYLPSGLQDTPEWQNVVETAKLLEAAAAKHLEWIEKERDGPQYGKHTRDTHPLGERIWQQWWQEQLDLCGDTEALCRAAIAKARGDQMTYTFADASKVSGREFLDALTGSSPESRAERDRKHRELCIRLIEVGHSMYGWPPETVAECKQIIAERAEAQLTSCVGDPLLNKRRART